ncbi:DUF2637 domain-containing protein [Actinocorallia lasiicapitis]
MAGIAAVVSYRHMHELAVVRGESRWTAALIPLSVDGMIVVASMSILVESRAGRRGGWLPWVLLGLGSLASLAANVAVAEPTTIGRVIAAWPSLALLGAYELLMGQLRGTGPAATALAAADPAARLEGGRDTGRRSLQSAAWAWALSNRAPDGSFPDADAIAVANDRSLRWGRQVRQYGLAGVFGARDAQVGSRITSDRLDKEQI